MTRRRRGRADQAARHALAHLVAAGRAVCWRCTLPIHPTDQWDAGHTTDLALGGHPAGTVAPEHRRCNRSAGADLGNAIRARKRVRLADWLVDFFPEPPPGNTPECPVFLPGQPGDSPPPAPAPIPPPAYQEDTDAPPSR